MGATVSMDQLRGLIRDETSRAVQDALKAQENNSATRGVVSGMRAAAAGGGGAVKEIKKGVVLGRLVRSLAAAKFDPDRALKMVKDGKFGAETNIIEAVERAMQAGNATAGGFWLDDEMSNDIIELLDSKAVVRGTNPMRMDMATGVMQIPKVTEGTNAGYIGEGRRKKVSQVSAGQVTLSYKKLAAFCPISNDLLVFGGDRADMIVRNDLVRSMRVTEDRAFLRGSGSEFSPKGMRNWALADRITASNGVTLAQIRQDAMEMIGALEDADVPMENCWWFMHPRTKNYLMFCVADSHGNLVFAEELSKGMFCGYPYACTTSVPKNLGVTGNSSELMFTDMADMVIGESTQIQITASDVAAFEDEDGNIVSAFHNDETVVKAIARHDFGARRQESIVVKTGVQYGA